MHICNNTDYMFLRTIYTSVRQPARGAACQTRPQRLPTLSSADGREERKRSSSKKPRHLFCA